MYSDLLKEIGDDIDRLRDVRKELLKIIDKIDEQIVIVAKRMSLN